MIWEAVILAGSDAREKRHVKMAVLLKIVAGVLCFYLVYCGLLFLLQRQILFPRFQVPALPEEIPDRTGLEKIWINTDYGHLFK